MLELPFHPHPTGWVNERVYAIAHRGTVNTFVYRTQLGAIAIDTGYDAQGLEAALQKAGLSTKAVSHVLLTHSDRDHAGGLSAFPQAHVYLGADEEPLVTQRQTRFLGLTHSPRLPAPYVLLHDGDTLEIDGVTVRAISTPGHTLGSMSYLLDERVLFTGDTIALRGGRARPFFALLNMDRSAIRQSLRRLAQLNNIALLCTAHAGCTTDWERAIARWRTTAL